MQKVYTRSNINPFNTRARKLFPTNIKQAFDWAQWMDTHIPSIGTCISKVVRYFASDITVIADTDPQKTDASRVQAAERLLDETYHTLDDIIDVGQELAKMGNVFVSAQQIFNRTACCPNCSFAASIKALRKNADYQWQQGDLVGVCPQCEKKITYLIVDKPTQDQNGRAFRFIIRSPRDMIVSYNELTGTYKYLYKLPDNVKQGIIKGDPVYIQDTPKLYIQAAFKDGLIQFPADKFFHKRLKCMASLDRLYRGWGAPLFLSSFDNLLNLAYLDRFNQVVASDYIAPIRMISPPPQTMNAGTDPNRATTLNGYQLKMFINETIKGVRDNQTQWVTSPVPLNYQMIGGQAKQMAPVQLMQWYQNRFMEDIALPLELRQTSFQAVSQTMGLRMFQRMWIHFFSDLDDYLRWKANIIFQAHSMQNFKTRLDKTSFVQNDMNKQAYLQMLGGGIVSRDTALKSIGLDWKDEAHKTLQESKYDREIQTKDQAEAQGGEMLSSVLPPAGSVGVGAAQANIDAMQQAQQPAGPQGAPMPPMAGGAPGGAMPGMPFSQGNSQSATLDALYNQAQQKAQQIMQIGQMQGIGARMSALRQLKAQDPTLHAQVKQIIKDMQSQVGRDAINQSRMPQ